MNELMQEELAVLDLRGLAEAVAKAAILDDLMQLRQVRDRARA
jgi:hypothetical protein